jgi:amidohydrolase
VERGIAGHGVLGTLTGGKPGPTIAARADMDALALPVPEATGLPFASKVKTEVGGQEVHVMHACGHDVHMAAILGTALTLAEQRADLPGTVKFLFQPAEEGPPVGEEGGAKLMVEEGFLEKHGIQAIFALHVWPNLDVGTVGYEAGGFFASADRIRIRIRGSQTHAAYPWQGTDAIVAAAQAILALQTIHSRQLDARQPSVISIAMIRGGSSWNVLPEEVDLAGTIRTYSEDVQAEIRERIERTLKGITEASGTSYEILEYASIAPVTTNDPELTERCGESLREVLGSENVRKVLPTLGGEDFGYFTRKIPGFYYRVGGRPAGRTDFPPLHSPEFGPDRGAVDVGVKTMTRILLDHLRRNC